MEIIDEGSRDNCIRSFVGKRHCGNVAIRPGDGVRDDMLVLRIWRKGTTFGDGDTQCVVLDRDLVPKVVEVLESVMRNGAFYGYRRKNEPVPIPNDKFGSGTTGSGEGITQ